MERVSVILPVGISCHSTPLQTSKPFEPAPKLISASRHARHNNDLKAPQHSSKQTAGTTAGRGQQAAPQHASSRPAWTGQAGSRSGTRTESRRRGEMARAAQACCAQQHAARWDWEQVEPARGDDGRLLQDDSVVGQSVAGQQPDGAEVPAVANGAASCRHNRPLMASPFRATNSKPTLRQLI
jgi:hypothetical protein